MKWIFFGTDEFATIVLEELKTEGFIPSLIICAPDTPMRRKKGFTPPAAKKWALENNIQVLQPTILDEDFIMELQKEKWDLWRSVAIRN